MTNINYSRNTVEQEYVRLLKMVTFSVTSQSHLMCQVAYFICACLTSVSALLTALLQSKNEVGTYY